MCNHQQYNIHYKWYDLINFHSFYSYTNVVVKQENKNMEEMAVGLLPSFSCMYWVKSRFTSVRIAGDQFANGTQGRSTMK